MDFQCGTARMARANEIYIWHSQNQITNHFSCNMIYHTQQTRPNQTHSICSNSLNGKSFLIGTIHTPLSTIISTHKYTQTLCGRAFPFHMIPCEAYVAIIIAFHFDNNKLKIKKLITCQLSICIYVCDTIIYFVALSALPFSLSRTHIT